MTALHISVFVKVTVCIHVCLCAGIAETLCVNVSHGSIAKCCPTDSSMNSVTIFAVAL